MSHLSAEVGRQVLRLTTIVGSVRRGLSRRMPRRGGSSGHDARTACCFAKTTSDFLDGCSSTLPIVSEGIVCLDAICH
jgi:hypothetical protein